MQQNKLITALVSLLDETTLYFKSNVWNEHLWIKTLSWEKAFTICINFFPVCLLHWRHAAGFGDRQDKTDPYSLLGLLPFIVNRGPGSCERGRGEDMSTCHTYSNVLWTVWRLGKAVGLLTVELHSFFQHCQRSNTFPINIKIDYPIHCVFCSVTVEHVTISCKLCGGPPQHPLFIFFIALHSWHPGLKFFTISVWLNVVMIRI